MVAVFNGVGSVGVSVVEIGGDDGVVSCVCVVCMVCFVRTCMCVGM